MISWKILTAEETEEVYDNYLKRDFPPQEVKPLKTIRMLMEKGVYRPIGYYVEGQLVGYSFLCHHRDGNTALLDYLAVDSKKRGRGYGQKIIEVLQKIYEDCDSVILEAENPAYAADQEQLEERRRRIHFYEKCGTVYNGLTSNIFDVDYCILQIPCSTVMDRPQLRQALTEIYRDLVREPYFTRKVFID